jgi:hypothetical protein
VGKFFLHVHSPDKPQPKRTWLVREIPNPKFQIPNEEGSFGQILNAFGEGHKVAFFKFEKLGGFFLSVNALY